MMVENTQRGVLIHGRQRSYLSECQSKDIVPENEVLLPPLVVTKYHGR